MVVRLLLLGLMSFFVGCATYPKAVEPNAIKSTRSITIQVANHGWHTGLILPSQLVYSKLPELESRFIGAHFLEIGWGDAGFYQSNEITSGITFRAIFLPTDSVVHVVGLDQAGREYFTGSDIKDVSIDSENIDSLLTYLSYSFERDLNGLLIPLSKGIYGDSQFYAGEGSYYALNTCNKWTAKALYSAGVDISPLLKLTASSVMESLED
jgi:uncharacterized protein (TIGR02117 family)